MSADGRVSSNLTAVKITNMLKKIRVLLKSEHGRQVLYQKLHNKWEI